MNSQVFKGLKLNEAMLKGNECIDRNSHDNIVGKNFLTEVSKKCGFTESKPSKNKMSCLKITFQFTTTFIFCSCCKNSSAINSPDFFISDRRHDGVNRIDLRNNPKLEFLPVSIFLKFSNVQTYDADRCSIREISKNNFEHLLKLESLNLSFNRIKIIKHNTFEGLPKLERILLSNVFKTAFTFSFSQEFFHRQQPNHVNEWTSV